MHLPCLDLSLWDGSQARSIGEERQANAIGHSAGMRAGHGVRPETLKWASGRWRTPRFCRPSIQHALDDKGCTRGPPR
jgi:hypothetical protein